MGRVELGEAVALAVRRVEAPYAADGPVTVQEHLVAAAAIGVVLAEARQSIEALGGYQATPDAPRWVRQAEALAVLAALVPPPLV